MATTLKVKKAHSHTKKGTFSYKERYIFNNEVYLQVLTNIKGTPYFITPYSTSIKSAISHTLMYIRGIRL